VLPLALSHWRKDHLLWSQETLARKASATPLARSNGISVSPSTVAMIESGKRQPSRLVAEVLAEAMSLPVGAFAVVGDDEQVA
jgi:transcriptional regulator with XRE-family HTH domain